MSRDPKRYKNLFKKYPKSYVSKNVEYKMNRWLDPEQIYIDGLEGDVENRLPGHEYQAFAPLSVLERAAANRRGSRGSLDSMEEVPFPQFNSELPVINIESEIDSMAELGEFNMMLIDKMYTAYNEDADKLLRDGNAKGLNKNKQLLEQIERERVKELKKAKNDYNVAAEVFGVQDSSNEEIKDEESKPLIKKKKFKHGGIPASYYKDVEKIKEKKEKEKREKLLDKSLDGFEDPFDKLKNRGPYAVDQTVPLRKQGLYDPDISQIQPPPPKVNRKQIQIEPFIQRERRGSSSDEIEEDPVNFQSAIMGRHSQDDGNKGLTSIQEQPHKYSLAPKRNEDDPLRDIKQENFDIVRGNYQMTDADETESVPLSVIPSENNQSRFKKMRKNNLAKLRNNGKQPKYLQEHSFDKPRPSQSLHNLSYSRDAPKSSKEIESRSLSKHRKSSQDYDMAYRSPEYLNRPKHDAPGDISTYRPPAYKTKINTDEDVSNIYGKIYDPAFKRNEGAVKFIKPEDRVRKQNITSSGFFVMGAEDNDGYPPKPPSRIISKGKGKGKRKGKSKKKKRVKREHIGVDILGDAP